MESANSGEQRGNPNALYLKGRLQVSTARDALLKTGLNPVAERELTTILGVHNQSSYGGSQNNLIISLQRGDTAGMKADIIASLIIVADDGSNSEDEREASRALHELLTKELPNT